MQKINFQDLPSTSTPLNASTLNQMQDNIDNGKQDKLVSGTNIKTINANSILGSGNLAIVSSGQNANGKYVKFDDGTMICYKNATGIASISETWGDGFTTGSINTIDLGAFPATFIGDIPTVNLTCSRNLPGTFNYWLATLDATSLSDVGKVSLLRFTSNDSVSYNINIIAIGKWK